MIYSVFHWRSPASIGGTHWIRWEDYEMRKGITSKPRRETRDGDAGRNSPRILLQRNATSNAWLASIAFGFLKLAEAHLGVVSSRFPRQRSPDPCAGKCTVYEDKSRHLIPLTLAGKFNCKSEKFRHSGIERCRNYDQRRCQLNERSKTAVPFYSFCCLRWSRERHQLITHDGN
jgi:hypothetical protein